MRYSSRIVRPLATTLIISVALLAIILSDLEFRVAAQGGAPPPNNVTYYSDPSSAMTVNSTNGGQEIILHKELTAYGNYGAADGAADILYTGQAATWHFTLPASIDPAAIQSAFFRVSINGDDHSGSDLSQYAIGVWTGGVQKYSGPANVPHGSPFNSVFNNWVQQDYQLALPASAYDITLANQSNAGGTDWLAVDWIELHLSTTTASSQPGIVVVSGTYGGNAGVPTGNVTSDLAASCNGLQTCNYTVSAGRLGDPAPGVSKNYVATWRCGSDPTVYSLTLPPEAGFGSLAFLTCDGVVPAPASTPMSTSCGASTTSGLAGYWPEDGNANDVVGANNPSATNTISFVPGKIAQGVKVGSGGYIEIPDSANLDTPAITLSAWARPDGPGPNSADSAGSEIIAKDTSRMYTNLGGPQVSIGLYWKSDTYRFQLAVGKLPTVETYFPSAHVFPPGQFYHVVGTYDGTTANLYVNGVLEASQAINGPIDYDHTVPWTIGSTWAGFRSVGFPRTWPGVIDDARIYNRALAPAEITGLYGDCNATPTPTPTPAQGCNAPPAGQGSKYSAEGNANDSLGSHNGTLENGATFGAGVVGQAFSFNGSNQYVDAPQSCDFAFNTQDFTIDTWVNFNQVPAPSGSYLPEAIFVGSDTGAGYDNKWLFALINGQLTLQVNNTAVNGGLSDFLAPATYSFCPHRWYHLAFTKVGNTYTTYVNGQAIGTDTRSAPVAIGYATGPLTIGQAEGLGYISGLMDEVEILNRGLAASEVANIYTSHVPANNPTGSCAAPTPTPTPTATPAQGCNALPAGQGSKYSAEGNANDSLNGHNGTLENGATFAAGVSGQAFSLNGVNQFVNVPQSCDFAFAAQDFTLDTWVNFNQVPAPSGSYLPEAIFIGSDTGAGYDNKWLFALVNGRLTLQVNNTAVNGGLSDFLAPAAYSFCPNRWYHLAFTKVGNTYTTYVDGQAVATDTRTAPVAIGYATGPLTIGQAEGLGYINGLMDEVEILNRGLAASEVANIYTSHVPANNPTGSCAAPTPTTCSASTTSGLVGYWPEDGNANDVVGANNPTATNALSFVPGQIAQGVSPGSGGYIDIAHNGSLDNQQFTLSAWTRPDGPGPNNDTAGGSVIIQKGLSFPQGATSVSTALWWSAVDNRFTFAIGDVASQSVRSTDAFPPGQFYQVTGTYDGAALKLFVNGQPEGEKALATTVGYDQSVPWTIGSTAAHIRAVGYPRTWNGVIDDVRIYNRALTNAEIAGLYGDCGGAQPAPPTINGGLPPDGGILGPGDPASPGHVTTTVTGTAHPGCTVQLTVSDAARPNDANNNRTITTVVDQSGNWAIPLTLDDCDPVIDIVVVCDGVSSTPLHRHIYVDGTPPIFTGGGPVDGTTYTGGGAGGGTATIILDGSAADPPTSHCGTNCGGVTYQWVLVGGGAGGTDLILGGGGAGGTLTGGGSGLSIDLPPGDYDIEVIVTDAAGNRLIKHCHRHVCRPLTITGGLPSDGGIYGPGDGVTTGKVTRTIAGTGNPGCTVNINVSDPQHPGLADNNTSHSVTVDSSGNWSLPLTLDDCDPVIDIVEVCDGTDGVHITRHVYVDGTPPRFTDGGPSDGLTYTSGGGGTGHIVLSGGATDSGTHVPNGGVTYDWRLIGGGAGGTDLILGGGGSAGVLTGGGSGVAIDLPPGDYDFSEQVCDTAGNCITKRCHRKVRARLTVTGGLPGDGGIYGPGDGVTIGKVTRLVTGTGNPGCSVQVAVADTAHPQLVDNNKTYTVPVDAAGNWSLPLTLDDCDPVVTVTEICDGVGDDGDVIRQHVYVDGTPPTVGLGDGDIYVGTGGTGGIVLDAGAGDGHSFVPNNGLSYAWYIVPGGSGTPTLLCGTGCPGVYTVNEPVGDYYFQVVVTDRAGNRTTKLCHRRVLKRPTAITYTGDVLVANGGAATLQGVLTDITPPTGPTPVPVVGRPVTLTLGSGPGAQSCTGVTDSTGFVRCTVSPVNQPLGPSGVATDVFAGDDVYLPSNNGAQTLVFAFATATGSFVIGDLNARVGNQVTFWGAQWYKNNSLSGGPPPADNSFKGFESHNSTNPPGCGATWTTTPGNSPPPPASIPSYMGVIVSSSITKSGSTIAGNIPQIVIVRTDPGYDSNPGHAGTGTVVAVFCK